MRSTSARIALRPHEGLASVLDDARGHATVARQVDAHHGPLTRSRLSITLAHVPSMSTIRAERIDRPSRSCLNALTPSTEIPTADERRVTGTSCGRLSEPPSCDARWIEPTSEPCRSNRVVLGNAIWWPAQRRVRLPVAREPPNLGADEAAHESEWPEQQIERVAVLRVLPLKLGHGVRTDEVRRFRG
jgi:hypothetical protein